MKFIAIVCTAIHFKMFMRDIETYPKDVRFIHIERADQCRAYEFMTYIVLDSSASIADLDVLVGVIESRIK